MIKIYNDDCVNTMATTLQPNSVDCILTSPPYNMTPRKGGAGDSGRYDEYKDWLPEEDYVALTVKWFNLFERVLKHNKVVIYNFSYSIENPSLPYKLISAVEKETPFTLIDTIIWKKSCGMPFPANKQRLSRNWEFVWVLCRKSEINTFETNRKVVSINDKGQRYYEMQYNMIEARNNDGKCELNQATFSEDLVKQLLHTYVKPKSLVYDPFMGSGTTAMACLKNGYDCIGSELSPRQVEYAEERINSYTEAIELSKSDLW